MLEQAVRETNLSNICLDLPISGCKMDDRMAMGKGMGKKIQNEKKFKNRLLFQCPRNPFLNIYI